VAYAVILKRRRLIKSVGNEFFWITRAARSDEGGAASRSFLF
jgi:hypothetical protein